MVTSRVEIILNNTPFPGAGQQIGGHHVLESMVDVQGKNWAVYLRGKLTQAQVNAALSSMTKTHFALPVQDEFSLISFKPKGMTHARTNPPGDVTVVRGHMYYARPNPISKTDFHQEMDEMLIENPEKHFTKYIVKNKDQLHERLWKGVSYAGESYGWKKGDELWHRRASFIMPKIKINKALKGATMFYHTHPSKDEPSLTSADDIQFYLDLHFAWGIKSFYTVMKHKLDHFTITSKPGGAEKYLRMEEEAFIDTVDGMIGKGEEVAKKEVSEDRPEVEFQNRITKEMVDLFNKKFKSIAKISFRPKAKNPASKLARKSPSAIAALVNPAPNPPIRVEDQYISKALEELKGLDYAHEHYGADEYGHTMYVYWWLRHHLAPTTSFPKGRLFKLQEYGLDQETRHKLRAYLSQSIIGNYNYMDAVYLLALYHDIAKLREKKSKDPGWEIGAEMFRTEIGPELNLPSNLVEDLAFLFDTDLGRKNIKDDEFLTQSGDYYGAAKLVQMADMVTHHPLMYTGKAKEAKASGKIGMASGKKYKEYAMTELINDLRNFLDHHFVIQNPPPKVLNLKWMASYGIEDIPYQEARELLSDFHQSVIPDNNGKLKQPDDKSSGGHIYYMRFDESVIPGLTRTYSAQLALSSSNLTIDIGSPAPDDLGKKVASQIYQLVGSRLKESYTEIELEEPEPEAIVNPRHANKIQIISISGPSGGGKSTVLHYLHKHIPNSSIPPTYTTRPRRRSDGADRKFVSRTQFKAMLKRGEFVEWDTSGRHFYGRRFKDFLGNVAIIEVSLQGKKHYEKRFANVFSVYLDPDPSVTEKDRARAILRRGGVTKDEATRRAKNATETIKKSKKMQFDLRVTMLKGKYHEGAKKILSEIPLVNPPLSVAPRDISPYAQFKRYSGNADYTIEDWMQVERKKGANEKEDIKREQMKEAGQWATKQRNLVANGYAAYVSDKKGDLDVVAPNWYNEEFLWDYKISNDGKKEVKSKQWYGLIDQSDKPTFLGLDTFGEENPKDLFDWFEDWVKLVNMKNKELKTFLDSDWGKVAGLSPEEAKKLGINSGRTSGRRILKMRQKLGLTGPKDYIDPNKPRVIESFYTKAMDKWTGPATKKGTDWYWCTRQVRFNKRFMGDNFGERKGPLVRKQKTQNQPSRRLLSLWVWGHDPWRYARKVEKRESMPKCPSVPWIGMTEKRKYGVIEVIPGPKNIRKNPVTDITLKEIMGGDDYNRLLRRMKIKMERIKKPTAKTPKWVQDNNFWTNLAEFGYTGKSPERALEAIFNWHKKNVKSGIIKLYRTVVIPPDWERLERAWEMRGVGSSWSTKKEGADNYMNQHRFLQVYPVSEIAFIEGRVKFGDVSWLSTINNNMGWGTKEAEVNPYSNAKVFVDKVSFYRLDDSATEKYLEGLKVTTGKTSKPWLGRKNKPFLVVEPKKAYISEIFDNPRPNPEFWGNAGSGILVVAEDTKRILLGLRSKDVNEPFTWGNFGGAIGIDDYGNKEESLSPLKNALKEMKEEIGYTGKITPYKSYTFESESFIYHNFIGVVPKESMVKLDKFNWEVSELRWFTIEEIDQLPNLHFGLKSLLENVNPLHSVPMMVNPPSRPDQFTKTPIVYPGTIEKGLSANLLKAIKKVRQQNREYFGFASGTHIWTHTNFEVRSAGLFEDDEEKWKFINDNDIFISFHTHPIQYFRDKWQKWSDVPSPQDFAFAVYHRLNFDIAYEIICTQHGFFILQVLPKGKDSFSSWYTQEMFEHDSKVCLEAWNLEDGAERFRGVLTPLQHVQDTVRHINKNTKGVKFKLTFYDNPIIAVKWTEEEDGGWKGKRIKVNPQEPGMKTAFQRFQIGAYYGEPAVEDEHGHRIEGGKFDHEVHGMSEIIVVDSEDYPETKQFLDELYDEWLEAAKEIGIKEGGWFTALKATVNLRRYPPSNDFFEDFVKWKVSQGFLDKTFPIHEIVPYGGVCRHLGIVAAAILRRAIEEGHLGGKVYFDLGPGHAWTRYVTKSGTPIIFDAAQDKYGYLEDVNSGSRPGFEDGDGNRYLYPSGNLIYLNKEGFRDNPRTNQPTLDLAEIQQLYDESLAALEEHLAARQEIRDLLVLEEDEKFRAGYKALIAEYDGFIASALDTMKKMEHLATQIAPTLDLTDPSFRANPRTKKGRKFPSKYLKGLTATEKAIAIYEIDRGYEYDMDDPKAYEDWKSDIKAKARGLKTVPSKWRNKFAKKYGPLKKGYDFLDRMSKTTGVKRKYLKKIQDKGLAAWRVGHRPGVTPMQWARGRVYAFVMAAPSSTGPGKPDHKLAVEAGVR